MSWEAVRDRVYGVVTLACEASSEDEICQQAVAASLRNRVKAGRWQPNIAAVCMQRFQYSEFNDDAADNANLERVLKLPGSAPELLIAGAAFDAVMADPSLDPSNGATHFYADGIPRPRWAIPPARLVAKHGCVNFYADVP